MATVRGKALVGALQARPDTRNAAALAVWCGRYKNVRSKIKDLAPDASARESVLSMLNLSAENRDRAIKNMAANKGNRNRQLFEIARDNPKLTKVYLERQQQREDRLKKLKAANTSSPDSRSTKPSADDRPVTFAKMDAKSNRQRDYALNLRSQFVRQLRDSMDGETDEQKAQAFGRYLNSESRRAKDLRKALTEMDDADVWIDALKGAKDLDSKINRLIGEAKSRGRI